MTENLIHLRRPGVSVVVDISMGVPVIAHWGRELETIDRDSILASVYLPKQPGGVDVVDVEELAQRRAASRSTTMHG